jgi:ABC-type transporter Mla subunit MlaD
VHLPPVPGPRAVRGALEHGVALVDQLVGALPRVGALMNGAEALLVDVRGLIARIEGTRAQAAGLVSDVREPVERLAALLDRLEPALTRLGPTLDRLSETTDPREVDAAVGLVDRLPRLADSLERDVLPMLSALGSVAPDIRQLLAVSSELNEMLGRLPGMGRIKRRVEDEQHGALPATGAVGAVGVQAPSSPRT